MHKLFSTLILVVAVLSSAAHAQSDSGLIPNNTVLGNGSGSRGTPRQIPLGSDLSLSGNTMNVVTGTSGSAIITPWGNKC